MAEAKKAICTRAQFDKACAFVLGEEEAKEIKSDSHRMNQAIFKIFEDALERDDTYNQAVKYLRSALRVRKANGFFKFKDDE